MFCGSPKTVVMPGCRSGASLSLSYSVLGSHKARKTQGEASKIPSGSKSVRRLKAMLSTCGNKKGQLGDISRLHKSQETGLRLKREEPEVNSTPRCSTLNVAAVMGLWVT